MKAVIFDLNGTLLLDEVLWRKAFFVVWQKIGKHKSSFLHIPGIGLRENWEKQLQKEGVGIPVEKLVEMTISEYFVLLKKEGKLRQGFKTFLSFWKKHKDSLLIAMATSSERDVVDKTLKLFPELKVFEIIVTGDMVKHKKPDPEIFRLTLKKLKTKPHNTLILEDSNKGVEAGLGAGCYVAWTPNHIEKLSPLLLEKVATLHTLGRPLISLVQKLLYQP